MSCTIGKGNFQFLHFFIDFLNTLSELSFRMQWEQKPRFLNQERICFLFNEKRFYHDLCQNLKCLKLQLLIFCLNSSLTIGRDKYVKHFYYRLYQFSMVHWGRTIFLQELCKVSKGGKVNTTRLLLIY